MTIVPIILGGLIQVINLVGVGMPYVKFFSFTQLIQDGLVYLVAIGFSLIIIAPYFLAIRSKKNIMIYLMTGAYVLIALVLPIYYYRDKAFTFAIVPNLILGVTVLLTILTVVLKELELIKVPELIAHNKKEFKAANLEFHALDIATDDLPSGDCAILRQVLQHLSNAEIERVVEKLYNFKYVLLTEHLPEGDFQPNKDIISGQGIRLKKQSGVDLSAAPFNFKVKSYSPNETLHHYPLDPYSYFP